MTLSPPAKRFNWNNLGVRVVSALVLIPAAVAAVWFGGVWFLAMIALGAVLLSLEWGYMSEPGHALRLGIGVAIGVLAAILCAHASAFSAAFILLVAAAIAVGLYARMVKASAWDAAYGVLYIGWPCVVLVWLRKRPDGAAWTLLLFAVAWGSDVAAYCFGNLFKGPKLWPRFSPNKTWSGFLGGVLAGVLVSVGVAHMVETGLPARLTAVIGLATALATMGGDLWESALKRRFGVKDSGNLIPGHGGLMDRVDGLMFAVIAVAAAHVCAHLLGLIR